MPPVWSEVNTTADDSPPKDRPALSPPAAFAHAHSDGEPSRGARAGLTESLAAFRRTEALATTPKGSDAWRARDLRDWWSRARRLALGAGLPAPPVPPAAEVTEYAHAAYLDRLYEWAVGASAADNELAVRGDELAALNDRLLYAEAAIAHLADRLAVPPDELPDPLAPRLYVPESEVPW